MRALPLIALLLAGCDSEVTYSGFDMTRYFPFDGERTWEFVSTDTSIPYKLVSTMDSNHSTGPDGEFVYAVSTSAVCVDTESCTDAWVRSIAWSSDRTFGTRVHSLETPSGTTTFDPPLQMTDPDALTGDSVSTDVGGTEWTVTFEGLDTCPVIWTDQWGDQCIHLVLDDGGAGSELAGDYWAITQYNVVAFALAGDTGTWELSYLTFEP